MRKTLLAVKTIAFIFSRGLCIQAEGLKRRNMDVIYVLIRKRARQIVFRFPPPDFYKDFSWAYNLSGKVFETDPVIRALHAFAAEHLENDFGHGLKHAVKVTLDAGALMFIEQMGPNPEKQGLKIDDRIIRNVFVVQCAGILHDIRRKEKNHAEKGADYARELLKTYPLSPDETEDVSQAIRNHEAFRESPAVSTSRGLLISDCLYDADKFRWGPDNFTDTVWEMVSFSRTPLSEFIAFYPKGMEALERIKSTFRTHTGRKYGPQFIDIGLAVGNELYEVIKTEFAHLL